jgi:hypothetical protein
MGFELRESKLYREMRPLHSAVLKWTKANFAKLHDTNRHVSGACLVDGVTYDEVNSRLVLTYPAEGLRLEPHYSYLEVEPLPKKSEERRVRRRAAKKTGGARKE